MGWAAKLWNVMQITMPPLKADRSYLRFLKEHTKYNPREEYNPCVTSWSESAAVALEQMRPWHDVGFRGAFLSDFISTATTESAIRKIIADTSHAGGVRVRFLPGATYSN